MIRGTTPTFILTIDDDIDLTTMDNVYVTVKQDCYCLTKSGTDIDVAAKQVDVFLSQEETLRFKRGTALVQMNFTYESGKRGCTNIVSIKIGDNLYGGVLK